MKAEKVSKAEVNHLIKGTKLNKDRKAEVEI